MVISRTAPEDILEPATGPEGSYFRPGGEFGVGVEEELLLVDASNHLAARDDTLVDALGADLRSCGVVAPELFSAEIEFSTHACRGADELLEGLTRFRSALQRAGARPMAVGVHPAGHFGNADLTRSNRYDVIGTSLGGLLRTPTAALQVHVGMPDVDTAVAAYRVLRHRLAPLRALAAGSPYWHGQDSGLASSRWAVLKSYPRSGVPPAVQHWDQYDALIRRVTAAAEVPDRSHVWWDLRFRPALGTLEVRVMDAQPSLDAVAGLTALIQGVARRAVERPVEVDIPTEVLAENDFRAARYGLSGRIADTGGYLRPIRDVAMEMLRDAREVLAGDHLDAALCGIERILVDEPSYRRQRRLHAELGMAGVLSDLADRTASCW